MPAILPIFREPETTIDYIGSLEATILTIFLLCFFSQENHKIRMAGA